MKCATQDMSLLVPFVQDRHPCGRTHEGEFVAALRCPCCAYVAFPPPPGEMLDRFYSSTYPQASASWYNVETDYAKWKTSARAKQVIDACFKFGVQRGASIHEFGCAFGGTVAELREAGFDASGTELNASAVEQGRRRGNASIHAVSALDYLRGVPPIQAVYSFHALEHFPDPYGFMSSLVQLLADDGIVVLFLPNSAAWSPLVHGHMRYVWFGYPEHLHLWSPGAAAGLAAGVGAELLDVSTREFALDPALTRHAQTAASDTARLLRSANPAMLGEELILVLTRKGSKAAQKYAADAAIASAKSRASAEYERTALAFNEASLVDPWAK